MLIEVSYNNANLINTHSIVLTNWERPTKNYRLVIKGCMTKKKPSYYEEDLENI